MCPDEIETGVEAAGRAFQDGLAAPAIEAGAVIRAAMRETAETIEDVLVKATRTGRLSFADMARSVAADLGRIALNRFVTQPLANVLTTAVGGLFGGARAQGGPVDPGRAYLVGEQGPELFVPGASGTVLPHGFGGRGQVTINVHARDMESFRRSQSQIAGLMQRLGSRGARNL
ncbi:MAG TPA: phage tail tape measure protein [Alphaproteobacteria bacterium]|nr:phage tail tape measure protein [Alphaproteobacteria bacterium]HAJ48523.1 phage tail tape measure protein [Alphaproteobacteria bacterium]